MKLENNDLLLLVDTYIDANILTINKTVFDKLISTVQVLESVNVISTSSYIFISDYIRNCRKEIISLHE